jgi:hypothetical protein
LEDSPFNEMVQKVGEVILDDSPQKIGRSHTILEQ